MLKRKFEEKIDIWLKSNKVLLVDGARQVGKTYLIESFLNKNFKNYIYLNFSFKFRCRECF